MSKRRIAPIGALLAIVFCAAGAVAQDAPAGPTPPRLAFVDGDVSYWRPGAEDWVPAQVNTALAEGDQLYAAEGANLELQIGPRAFVRAGGDTQIALETLDDGRMQYELNGGHAAFDLKRLPPGQRIEIDTPKGAFTLDRPGYYRVDVDDERTTFSVRRGGAAHVVTESGDGSDVGDDQQLVLGGDGGSPDVRRVAALDDWDRWNYDRTSQLPEAPRSAQYVPPDVAGVDDLDRYGDWRDEPKYGRVWVPRDVAPDWAPYSAGRWVYDPYYAWTWVDEAPWGWCPYHYGRWVYGGGFWGWAPGPIVVRPAYAPALVAFFGAPGIGVSVSVGAPLVSWVALGFGEPVVPWWGGPRFVGRPYWGGWGGPRIVNNMIVHNTNIINVNNITRFQNMDVRNAVVGIDRGRFGRGGGRPVRVADARGLRPMRGAPDVRPAPASFVPRDGRGRRPPDRFGGRKIVTTSAPRDPIRRLRDSGVSAAPPPTRLSEARVVKPRGGGGRGFEQRASSAPATPDRMAAPSPHGPEPGPRDGNRFERAPEPPGRTATSGQHEAAPPTPPQGAARLRRDTAPAPMRRTGEPPRNDAQRTVERGPRERPPGDRPQEHDRRIEPSVPREAVPTPMPRGDRTRIERPPRQEAPRTARSDRGFARPPRQEAPRMARRERGIERPPMHAPPAARGGERAAAEHGRRHAEREH